MFADIVGFTAWSSVREPSQVFKLLETLYSAFDAIAHRRRVFKVETVGDCYGEFQRLDSVSICCSIVVEIAHTQTHFSSLDSSQLPFAVYLRHDPIML